MLPDKEDVNGAKGSSHTNQPDVEVRTQGGSGRGGLLNRLGFYKELKGTARLAWALVVTEMAEIYFQPVATMFGGHLGKVELDSIALANSLIMVTGLSIAVGMSTSCDTIFSQAYGNGNYPFIGVLLQRSLMIHLLALLPCFALHLNLAPILIAMGQDREVSRLAARYLLIFMPGMLAVFGWLVIRKYTQCQNVTVPHIAISLGVHGIHAVLQYVFLYQFHWGVEGSAAAQATAYICLFIFTVIYTVCSNVHKLSWTGWDRRCLFDWGPLASLAFFGMLMTCMEWWAFEISNILCGVLGTTELGAQMVAFNTYGLLYGIPSGVSIAIGIRAGQHLGSANPAAAKTAAIVGLTLTGCIAVVLVLVFGTARHALPRLFSDDLDVINMTAALLPFVCLYAVFESVTLVGRGIFRSAAMQMAGSVLMFVGYYVIGMPIALPLMFLTPMRILGFWIAFSVALFVVAVGYLVWIFFKMNWEKLSREAVHRSQTPGERSNRSRTENHLGGHEETPLLGGSHREKTTVDECEDTRTELSVTCGLVIKRLMCMVLSLSVLLMGILARYMTPDMLPDMTTSTSRTENATVTTSCMS